MSDRSAVIRARFLLDNAGYKVEGDENSWHMALEGLTNGQIEAATKQVIASHEWSKVLAATVVKKSSEVSYLGSGSGNLKKEDWIEWDDPEGRWCAWHPALFKHAHPPAGYDPNREDAPPPKGRKLSRDENLQRAQEITEKLNEAMKI